MTKKILPALIGAALAGGMTVAAADVTVFGHIDTSLNNVDFDPGGGSPSQDDTNFHCTTCSVGFKGSEDLGNGLKAIFKIDFQYDIINRNRASDGTNSILDRDQWLGLAGGFGQVRIGTISTVYKSHGAMIDPLYRTFLQGRDHGLQSILPQWCRRRTGRSCDQHRALGQCQLQRLQGGCSLHAGLAQRLTVRTTTRSVSAAATRTAASWCLPTTSPTTASATAPNRQISHAWKVGGKYSLNNFAVMGQYEDGEDDTGAGEEGTLWHIAGTYTMGNNTIYAGYGQATDEATGVPDVDTDAWTIAGMHNMSKRTMVYLGYNKEDEDNGPEVDTFSLGVKHKF